MKNIENRLDREEHFHDEWALSENIESINVDLTNEALTAPEMRFIVHKLGDINGKTLLDVGCGLGEAGVYFAKKGAQVTVSDLSEAMLEVAKKLATLNGVNVESVKSPAEGLELAGRKFDIIYLGNLFHHVDTEEAIKNVKSMMHSNSIMVSWDPVAYNPLINLYRMWAKDVRTEDEHPLGRKDIGLFYKHFESVEIRFFWLTTLLLFILMVLFQFRNPNKERFWKVVIKESAKWEKLYKPLEKIDNFLLGVFPFLGWLCWNVVVVARLKKNPV